MTNEQLAVLIQNGELDKLPVLWEQVERFVSMQAAKMATKLNGRYGVTAEDLYQSGYLAMVEAVKTFSASSGSSFIGWLQYYLKREFARCGGWLTERQKSDPINSAVSIDAPLTVYGSDETTITERLADPDGSKSFEDCENTMWRTQLRSALENALDEIPKQQAETIRRRYFQGNTLIETGGALGVSGERVRQLEEKALLALRDPEVSKPLEAFIEVRTPYFLSVSVREFKRTQTSAVERVAMIRERLQRRYERGK